VAVVVGTSARDASKCQVETVLKNDGGSLLSDALMKAFHSVLPGSRWSIVGLGM
jgi:hypothetical protein